MQQKLKRTLLALRDLEVFVAAIHRNIRTSWKSNRAGMKMHAKKTWKMKIEITKKINNKTMWFWCYLFCSITHLYADHDWICTCLCKESDIVEFGIVEVIVQIRPKRNDLYDKFRSNSRLDTLTLGCSEPSVRRTDHHPPQVFWSGPIGPSASTMSPRTFIYMS